VAQTNQAGAKQGSTTVYDPFGNVVSGAPVDNQAGSFDYRWLGQYLRPLESQTGLMPTIEMGARQYSPKLGRFLETDPQVGGSCNAYDYVCNDSVNSLDLNGERRYQVYGRYKWWPPR
jgi:RHS repeat-associated protein